MIELVPAGTQIHPIPAGAQCGSASMIEVVPAGAQCGSASIIQVARRGSGR
jgi:hypothetical protein